MKKSVLFLSYVITLVLVLLTPAYGIEAAVVEKNGKTVMLIDEPDVDASIAGSICDKKMYYNKAINRMDSGSEIELEAYSTYIYTTEFSSGVYTDEQLVKLITNMADVEAYKEQAAIIFQGGEIKFDFLDSLSEDDFKAYDILTYSDVYYGSYGNFSVLDHVQEGENITIEIISMNALHEYDYSDEEISVKLFGKMIPIVKYYVLPKGEISKTTSEIIISESWLEDYSQTDLVSKLPLESIKAYLQELENAADSNHKVLKGDVNKDNRLNAKDALMILKYVAKLIKLDDDVVLNADINGDNLVNAEDALEVLKTAAGIPLNQLMYK